MVAAALRLQESLERGRVEGIRLVTSESSSSTTLEEQPRSVAERLLAVRGWTIGPHDH
jgi:hypothetical protein